MVKPAAQSHSCVAQGDLQDLFCGGLWDAGLAHHCRHCWALEVLPKKHRNIMEYGWIWLFFLNNLLRFAFWVCLKKSEMYYSGVMRVQLRKIRLVISTNLKTLETINFVDGQHRFHQMSDAEYMDMIYAIRTNDPKNIVLQQTCLDPRIASREALLTENTQFDDIENPWFRVFRVYHQNQSIESVVESWPGLMVADRLSNVGGAESKSKIQVSLFGLALRKSWLVFGMLLDVWVKKR